MFLVSISLRMTSQALILPSVHMKGVEYLGSRLISKYVCWIGFLFGWLVCSISDEWMHIGGKESEIHVLFWSCFSSQITATWDKTHFPLSLYFFIWIWTSLGSSLSSELLYISFSQENYDCLCKKVKRENAKLNPKSHRPEITIVNSMKITPDIVLRLCTNRWEINREKENCMVMDHCILTFWYAVLNYFSRM